MSLSLLQGLFFVVGAYEVLVRWLPLPPFTTHGALRKRMRFVGSMINGVPFVLLGLHMAYNEGRIGRLPLLLAVPYVTEFTVMQAYYWWLPYLFGIVTPARRVEYEERLRPALRLLPPLPHSAFVPPAERALLFPLCGWTLHLLILVFSVHGAALSGSLSWAERSLLGLFQLLQLLLPLGPFLRSVVTFRRGLQKRAADSVGYDEPARFQAMDLDWAALLAVAANVVSVLWVRRVLGLW